MADANTRVEDMILVANRLCEVIAAENAALDANSIKAAVPLQEDKALLSRMYAQRFVPLTEEPAALASVPTELRAELFAAAQRLRRLGEHNMRLLKVAMDANNRLLGAVVEAVKERQSASATYGRGGSLGAARPPAAALAFNETL